MAGEPWARWREARRCRGLNHDNKNTAAGTVWRRRDKSLCRLKLPLQPLSPRAAPRTEGAAARPPRPDCWRTAATPAPVVPTPRTSAPAGRRPHCEMLGAPSGKAESWPSAGRYLKACFSSSGGEARIVLRLPGPSCDSLHPPSPSLPTSPNPHYTLGPASSVPAGPWPADAGFWYHFSPGEMGTRAGAVCAGRTPACSSGFLSAGLTNETHDTLTVRWSPLAPAFSQLSGRWGQGATYFQPRLSQREGKTRQGTLSHSSPPSGLWVWIWGSLGKSPRRKPPQGQPWSAPKKEPVLQGTVFVIEWKQLKKNHPWI